MRCMDGHDQKLQQLGAVPNQTANGKTHQNSEGQNVPVVAVDFEVFIVKHSAL